MEMKDFSKKRIVVYCKICGKRIFLKGSDIDTTSLEEKEFLKYHIDKFCDHDVTIWLDRNLSVRDSVAVMTH